MRACSNVCTVRLLCHPSKQEQHAYIQHVGMLRHMAAQHSAWTAKTGHKMLTIKQCEPND